MLNIDTINLFYGASHALRGVSLSAQPGRVTCVLGRNGVGKTSLMRAIMGLQAVRTGAISWEGKDITRLSAHDRARHGISFVPQGREIFARLTVRENLETGFAPLPRGKRTIPDDVFELFPVLKTMLHRRGGDLSGGQQQQLAIARALVTRPRLLILDEPTEGIQPSIIKDIGRVIRLLADGKLAEWGNMAVVLVEQYFDFAKELADDFAVMDRGEVVLSGQAATMVEDDVRRYLTV
ncbi:urea ABC transporter ATP-binding subunit UrtE [Insolitispirillum peregrinum]|uniref:urea ABC transporter ATP-binding subunit UrtE n=1 Tax=Insolitispirillum peregrinum TaxID=80876 RepID=UPI00361FB116